MNLYLYISLCLFLLLPALLFGQTDGFSKEFHDSVEGVFDIQNEELRLQRSSLELDDYNRIKITGYTLRDGDLLIEFGISAFRKKESNLSMLVFPELNNYREETYQAEPLNLKGDIQVDFKRKDQALQLIWIDFLDKYRLSDDSIQLHLVTKLTGASAPFDCKDTRDFGSKKQLPYYLGGGVGAGVVLAGFALKESGKKLHRSYIDDVFYNVEDSLDKYNRANFQFKFGDALMAAGMVVLVADGAWYLIRYLRYREKVKDKEYYCPGGSLISFYPNLDRCHNQTNVGFRLKWSF